MTRMKIGVAVALLLAGCPPSPNLNPPPSKYDASPGDASLPALRCCATLVMLGCEEGKRGSCGERVDLILSDKLTRFDVDCCAGAATKEVARTCSPAIRCD